MSLWFHGSPRVWLVGKRFVNYGGVGGESMVGKTILVMMWRVQREKNTKKVGITIGNSKPTLPILIIQPTILFIITLLYDR